MIGHRQNKPVPGRFPGLEDGQAVLFLPFLVADEFDGDAFLPRDLVQVALHEVRPKAGDDDELPDPAPRPARTTWEIRDRPPILSRGLLSARTASRRPMPAAIIRHFTLDSPNEGYNLSILMNFAPICPVAPRE